MTEEEINQFTEASAKILRSGTLILGDHTAEFERAFAEFIGVKHAISVNSGSTALEILLRLKKVEGENGSGSHQHQFCDGRIGDSVRRTCSIPGYG